MKKEKKEVYKKLEKRKLSFLFLFNGKAQLVPNVNNLSKSTNFKKDNIKYAKKLALYL